MRLFYCSALLILGVGCASTRPTPFCSREPSANRFRFVGTIDFRSDTLEDYRKLVQPGDLIITYMRLGRAVKKREWLFCVLPHGHSILVVDPMDEQNGLFECRFRGARTVGIDELRLYSYNLVYRLEQPEHLDLARLREFAKQSPRLCQKYSFKSWLTLNDEMMPTSLEDLSPQYTCSTMVVAGYHYAGVTLDRALDRRRVITPLSIAASSGKANQFSPTLEVHPSAELGESPTTLLKASVDPPAQSP